MSFKSLFALAAAVTVLLWNDARCQPIAPLSTVTWTPDNGNGTYTNPIFYDEFSDPDVIRVGAFFYLTGTTMHAMPGLPILRSKDLVNWEFVTYAMDKLDLGPEYRLEGGKNIYGRGIWAPCLRYHNGTFYIFANVNGQTTQIFTARDPKGPWTHRQMKRSFHDLSVLFDDDGKTYVVWDYQTIHIAQLNDDLTDTVPGTERILFAKGAGMGEGSHFYKINGKYFILSANYAGGMRMSAARADRVFGPYEVNPAISTNEDFGLALGNRLSDAGPPARISPTNPSARNGLSLHQGAIVKTPQGEWWGMSMMDANSVGRLTALSPITWRDGWPYFGLPGNLQRTPRTWIKPRVAAPAPIQTPYVRSDDFSEAVLKPIWQWNHVPVDAKWSLSERPGFLRLHSLPANTFWEARDSLTQRAIGPMSSVTVTLDASGLQDGDIAGLALLNRPYATLGVEKSGGGLSLVFFDQVTGKDVLITTGATSLSFRADCDFLSEKAHFSYSTDGKNFTPIGDEFTMVFQLTTFQGVRYALFNYNTAGHEGGYADFDSTDIHQPFPHGMMRPIPYGASIRLMSFGSDNGLAVTNSRPALGAPASFTIIDLGLGRVALTIGKAALSVDRAGRVSLHNGALGLAQTFQWSETPTGELVLMSLASDRFLRIDPQTQVVSADSPGPLPDDSDGDRFVWGVGVKADIN